jgi:hypothetical protein
MSILRSLSIRIALLFTMTLCVVVPSIAYGLTSAEILKGARVETSPVGFFTKVAPGEVFPVTIELLNFGSNERVDVTVFTEVLDEQQNVVNFSEDTIAVETTATFIKSIHIHPRATPGDYVVKSSVRYQDQVVPATTQFSFSVERKWLGLYQSDFLLYSLVTLIVSVLVGVLGHVFLARLRISRIGPLEYHDVPEEQRAFYELVSDTILEMRQHVGDVALDIASHVDGLVVDQASGRVTRISRDPSEIIVALVDGYEKVLLKRGWKRHG